MGGAGRSASLLRPRPGQAFSTLSGPGKCAEVPALPRVTATTAQSVLLSLWPGRSPPPGPAPPAPASARRPPASLSPGPGRGRQGLQAARRASSCLPQSPRLLLRRLPQLAGDTRRQGTPRRGLRDANARVRSGGQSEPRPAARRRLPLVAPSAAGWRPASPSRPRLVTQAPPLRGWWGQKGGREGRRGCSPSTPLYGGLAETRV